MDCSLFNINMPLKDTFIPDFEKVDPHQMWLGASQLAVGTQDGRAVAAENVSFPFALVFDPAPGLRETECQFSNYISQLQGLASSRVGQTLYEVYAVHDPWVDRPSPGPGHQQCGDYCRNADGK